jgi:hypothetical protein
MNFVSVLNVGGTWYGADSKGSIYIWDPFNGPAWVWYAGTPAS